MENGFYKYDDGELLFGQRVESMEYHLSLEAKDDFVYPIDGWHYFDTLAIAKAFFNIVDPEPPCPPCP